MIPVMVCYKCKYLTFGFENLFFQCPLIFDYVTKSTAPLLENTLATSHGVPLLYLPAVMSHE